MIQKRKLLLILSVMFSGIMTANPVDKEDARKTAESFLNGRAVNKSRGAVKRESLQLVSSKEAYYVFNVGQKEGFVIVSGDDCAPDVLGYSDVGEFDEKEVPSNMKAWLQSYVDEIKWMKEHDVKTSHLPTRGVPMNSISPLIKTTWDQDNPYNLQCPDFFGQGKCVTGCVATAMAQVLYNLATKTNFTFPKGLEAAIPAYDCATTWTGDGKIHVNNIEKRDFDWDKIKFSYSGNEPEADQAAQAVAYLMSCCGASVNMDYANDINGGSSATLGSIPEAFKKYFGFDKSVAYKERYNYTRDEWEDMIYNELANGRPVLYGGQSSGGGHAFVCDGYDENRYFHINWGWSGDHNGNFLLSALNPHGTGSGGSSSHDGYSMDQSVIIGIQAPTGNVTEEECLMTIKGFDCSNKTIDKTSSFTIQPNFKFYSAMSYTHNVLLSLGVFNENNRIVKPDQNYSFNMESGTGKSGNAGFIIPTANLVSGNTYKIKLICRYVDSQEDWQELIGSDYYYINAQVTDNSIILSTVNPTINLTANNFVLTTNGIVNTVQTVRVDITNNSEAPFHDNLYMFVDGVKESGNGVSVEPGRTAAAYFSFKPSSSSTKTIKITTDKEGTESIGESQITITGSASVTGLSISDFSTNGANGVIYGNTYRASIKATNNGSETYRNGFAAKLYKKIPDTNTGTLVMELANDQSVASGANKVISFEFKDLEYGQTYFCWAGYYSGNTFNKTGGHSYKMTHGLVSIDSNGNIISATAPTAELTVPDNTSVVDLRGQSTVSSVITTSASPNCLYLLDEGAAVPTGLSKNVVKGNIAETIELTDGSDFYSPIEFTANEISYTRQFTGYDTDNGTGWSTICLPFTVSSITCGEKDLEWFHSESDTGKHFWLMKFSNDGPNEVNFGYTNSLEANTPYIMTVPDDRWGEEWNLAGKDITFTGNHVTIKSNPKAVVSGSNFKFHGLAKGQNIENVFVMNNDGDYFERKSSAQHVDPFRAYFDVVTYTNFTSSLSIGFNTFEATAIFNIKRASIEDNEAVYNLQGVKVGTTDQKDCLPKGVYIINKKKVIIK